MSHLAPFMKKYGLPLTLIIIALAVAKAMLSNPPKPQKSSPPRPVQQVEVMPLHAANHQIKVKSFGTVTPGIEGSLIAQVGGTITKVGPHFRSGDLFAKGELLLAIDDRDYRYALEIAKATLSEAELALAQERAQSAQAQKDWQRLGKSSKPDALVLRKPQLANAEAAARSAAAKLHQAELDLERTQVKAPYDGRILTKSVDIGQYVTAGTTLAQIFAIRNMEVRLPLSTSQQAVVELPDLSSADVQTAPNVTFTSQIGRSPFSWQGRLSRSEAALDSSTRQLYLIAQFTPPDSPNWPVRNGQFVEATIDGITLDNVFEIPLGALYPGDQILLLSDDHIERRTVSVAWKGDKTALIDEGIKEGEQLITTPLGSAVSGTKAVVRTQSQPES